jgi:hypothetical protein
MRIGKRSQRFVMAPFLSVAHQLIIRENRARQALRHHAKVRGHCHRPRRYYGLLRLHRRPLHLLRGMPRLQGVPLLFPLRRRLRKEHQHNEMVPGFQTRLVFLSSATNTALSSTDSERPYCSSLMVPGLSNYRLLYLRRDILVQVRPVPHHLARRERHPHVVEEVHDGHRRRSRRAQQLPRQSHHVHGVG